MAEFKALDMFIRNTTIFRNLGKHLPIEDDGVKFMAVIDYMDGVEEGFFNLSNYSSDSKANDSFLTSVYPSRVAKLLTTRSQKMMKGWLDDMRVYVNRGDESNEIKFLFYTLLIWHMVVKELYFPVLTIAKRDESRLLKIDYQTLGFRKPELKIFELLVDIQDTNIDDFLNKKNVSDKDLKRLGKYINRLVRYQASMEYIK